MSPVAPPLPDQPITIESADVRPSASCGVCAHPLDDHDPIARRYCTATLANALTRSCICPSHEA